MHPALRKGKGPLFFYKKTPPFFTFVQKTPPILHFYKPSILFPAYWPDELTDEMNTVDCSSDRASAAQHCGCDQSHS